MAKIRDDLFGVVHVHVKSGTVVLGAGDTVPRGAKVGKHLTDEDPAIAPSKEVPDSSKEAGTDEATDSSK